MSLRALVGLRSDRYAAAVELFSAVAIGALAQLYVRSAIGSVGYYLHAEDRFMVPKWQLMAKPAAFAAVHALPALLLIIVALLIRRRDPVVRPLLAAAAAMALGSANAVAVMGNFFGVHLLWGGVFAALLALRPNNLASLIAAAPAAGLLGHAAFRLNLALHPVLLAAYRGQHQGIDMAALGFVFLTGTVAMGLTAAALRLRVAAPAAATRHALLVVGCFLPASAFVYWLLAKLRLPLWA